MRYAAEIHVSDIMTEVAVQVRIVSWDGLSSAPEVCCEWTSTIDGYGIDDPVVWLERALQLGVL